MKVKKKNKYTLNQLGETVDKLVTKVDQIAEALIALNKKVDDGFKRIDTRLDYIVKANNLEDLPKNNQR